MKKFSIFLVLLLLEYNSFAQENNQQLAPHLIPPQIGKVQILEASHYTESERSDTVLNLRLVLKEIYGYRCRGAVEPDKNTNFTLVVFKEEDKEQIYQMMDSTSSGARAASRIVSAPLYILTFIGASIHVTLLGAPYLIPSLGTRAGAVVGDDLREDFFFGGDGYKNTKNLEEKGGLVIKSEEESSAHSAIVAYVNTSNPEGFEYIANRLYDTYGRYFDCVKK